MYIILIVFSICVLIAIVFFTMQFSFKGRSREQFLEEAKDYLHGKVSEIADRGNSVRISYDFEGTSFTFDDIEEIGFKSNIQKGYLRVDTKVPFTLTLSEREKTSGIRSEIFVASKVFDGKSPLKPKVKLPKGLEMFDAHTNNYAWANELLRQEKVVRLLIEYRNLDARGFYSDAIKILDGVVTLDFYPSGAQKPSFFAIRNNIPSFETYSDQVSLIANAIKKISRIP